MILGVGDCGGCQLVVFFFFNGGGGWQWLAMGVVVAMAVTRVAWIEKKVVEIKRHSGKIKIILFK